MDSNSALLTLHGPLIKSLTVSDVTPDHDPKLDPFSLLTIKRILSSGVLVGNGDAKMDR
jgi:hypothetical protein